MKTIVLDCGCKIVEDEKYYIAHRKNGDFTMCAVCVEDEISDLTLDEKAEALGYGIEFYENEKWGW